MKNQPYRMTLLLDFYGELLTQRQKEFFDLYYNEDLSLGEIAEHYGITRQGVRDVIVRAEHYMTEIEDRTGIIRRSMRTRRAAEEIAAAAEQIDAINRRQYDNVQISALTDAIGQAARALKE